ncbi:MAG: VanZ family protein [Candidatus Acidiferrales bacterium]
MRWLKLWWPALVWALVMSSFSTGVFTSDKTSRIIIPILRWLFPHSSPETLDILHHLIRKCAHFVEYFVLSLLVLRGIRAGRKETHLGWAIVAVGIVAGYAALDEFHQSFVPGRGPAVADVLLDTAGGVAAQLVAALIVLWGDVRKGQRSETSDT